MAIADTQTLSELLHLLSHPRRRFVVHYLQRSGGPVVVDSLATRLAAWEVADSVPEPDGCDVESVAVSLHHTHLPKLDEYGVLRYDADSGRVQSGARTVTGSVLDEELLSERREIFADGR